MNLATSQRVRTNNDYGSCKWVMHRFKRYDWCENETVCSDNINNIIKNSHIQVLINDRNMVYELTVNGKGLLNYERMTYLYREIFFISFAILFFTFFCIPLLIILAMYYKLRGCIRLALSITHQIRKIFSCSFGVPKLKRNSHSFKKNRKDLRSIPLYLRRTRFA